MSDTQSSSSGWDEIKAKRKAWRAELIARRAAVSPEQHRQWNERITGLLLAGFPLPRGSVVGFCWPYKGEFDARFAIRRWREQGVVAALPEVVGKAEPLRFRKWWPGAPMRAGVYDIPFPDGTDAVTPQAAIVPMNGYDDQGYRLGYGGGYFDRTLAADRCALVIGVSYEMLKLPTIYPQPHDIPMDFVVTERGIQAAQSGRLVTLDEAAARERVGRLFEARRVTGVPGADDLTSPVCYGNQFPGYWGEDKSG
jgi:5,10-methenyltetrahydrofolate synthetase